MPWSLLPAQWHPRSFLNSGCGLSIIGKLKGFSAIPIVPKPKLLRQSRSWW